jgi:4-amino-4-deoxy-L-arabinose transferase-like glycosyltransferase
VSGFLAIAWVVAVAHLMKLLIPRVSMTVALGIAVFWPPMLAMGDPTRSEMLFTVLLTVAAYLLARLYRHWPRSIFATATLTIAAWSALGAAALTKTSGIAAAGAAFVAVAFGFHSWSIRRRVAVLLVGTSVFGVVLAPWVLSYKEHTGNFGFTSNGFASVRDGFRHYPHFPLGLELSKRSEGWQSYADIWADLREVSAADQVGALRLLGIKFFHPWYATWTKRFDPYLLAMQLPWLAIFVWAGGRTVWRWRRIPGEIILLHGQVAALWLTAASVAPLLRYLSPAFPFVVIVVFWHVLDATSPGEEARDAQNAEHAHHRAQRYGRSAMKP